MLWFLIMYTGSKDFFSGSIQEMSYFDYKTLRKATMNFHPDNFLGSGGYGPVFRVIIFNLMEFS